MHTRLFPIPAVVEMKNQMKLLLFLLWIVSNFGGSSSFS